MQSWMTDTQMLLAAMGAADLLVVSGLAWLLARVRREREAALAGQRSALERLRADLGELVTDAEARTRALDNQMSAREASLRALLHEIGRTEAAVPAGAWLPRRDETLARRRRRDPAEDRLRRDVEASFGGRAG